MGIESIVVSTTAVTAAARRDGGGSYRKGKLKARQAAHANARASRYNILTRFLFNYRAVTASLRSLITLSPTGSELIPARLQPRFLAVADEKEKKEKSGR